MLMESIMTILAVIVFLSFVAVAVFLFYKAIRSFKAHNFRRGVWSLLFSFVLGLILVSLTIAVYGARELAQRAGCSSDLKQIVLFLKMYANDHQETYPSTFNGLRGDYIKPGDESVLVCPESHHKVGTPIDIHEWTDYAFVAGLSEADPVNCVVAFCLPEDHKGEGANVAFIGGWVKWFYCKRPAESEYGHNDPTFQELTNTPALFYGTTDEVKLADLKKRTRIIYPKSARR